MNSREKIREIAKENDVETINSVTVEVGTLSGVVPKFLTDCWVAVTAGTELEGTEMIDRCGKPVSDTL